MSSRALASSPPAVSAWMDIFLPMCTNCHLAKTFVMLSSSTERRRATELSTCVRPNSTMTRPGSWASGRSKCGSGTATRRSAGRRDVATRCTRCMSAGTPAASLLSRGYSTTMLPVKTLSTRDSSHCEAGTSSGTNSAWREMVSYFSTEKSCKGGCRSIVLPFFNVFFGSSVANRTGCFPTCAISKRRKGPSMRKRQRTPHALRFVIVTYRFKQDTMPGICAPVAAPPWVVPFACRRAAAGCGTQECMNLNIAHLRGFEGSVPSSSTSLGSRCGKSSALGSSFLSTVNLGMMTSPTQSTTSVEMTSPSGKSANGLSAVAPPPLSLAAPEFGPSMTSGVPRAVPPWPPAPGAARDSASESSSSMASILKLGSARTSSRPSP
mmetsp:Transcript_103377/g.289660  ORF Transcript_103377/g.289660 Transcript_103377/m.289660 type:complete len:380 (-) Transcript_103377:61-1200(-)